MSLLGLGATWWLASSFVPTAALDLAALQRLVEQRSPALQESRRVFEQAKGQAHQSGLLANPELDLSVGTIPFGQSNPPNSKLNPFTEVMNYGVGLSYRFELAKRGARQRRDKALLDSAGADAKQRTRLATLDFARVLGTLAANMLKRESTAGVVEQASQFLEIARSRLRAGYGTPLEVDRVEIDLFRLQQQYRRDDIDLSETLAECAAQLATTCEPFASTTEARRFLNDWLLRPMPATPDILQRADLAALQLQMQAAEHDADLSWATALPDPTLRVSYLHDRFLISGNQLNSLSVSVSFPLPVFDHGQAQVQSAEARAERYAAERDQRVDAAGARIERLRLSLQLERERRDELETTVLPRARAIVGETEKSVAAHLVPFTDAISARRVLNELLISDAESLDESFGVLVQLLAELPGEDLP